jgi:hypothetical protein
MSKCSLRSRMCGRSCLAGRRTTTAPDHRARSRITRRYPSPRTGQRRHGHLRNHTNWWSLSRELWEVHIAASAASTDHAQAKSSGSTRPTFAGRVKGGRSLRNRKGYFSVPHNNKRHFREYSFGFACSGCRILRCLDYAEQRNELNRLTFFQNRDCAHFVTNSTTPAHSSLCQPKFEFRATLGWSGAE